MRSIIVLLQVLLLGCLVWQVTRIRRRSKSFTYPMGWFIFGFTIVVVILTYLGIPLTQLHQK